MAGGSGSRMGSDLPKQFHLIGDKPVIWYSIKSFTEAYEDIRIILVLPAAWLDQANAIGLDFHSHVVQVVEGGKTRFESVKNGLAQVSDASWVFVHDAVRCLVTPELIRRCGTEAEMHGNAVPCVPPSDTMRVLIGERNEPLSRDYVRLVQTPQVFNAALLKSAFEQEEQPGFTDEASVVEALGFPIHLVAGEMENIKITTPVDMATARHLVSVRQIS